MKEGENRVVAEFNDRDKELRGLQSATNQTHGTHTAVLNEYKKKLEEGKKEAAKLDTTGTNGLHKLDATRTSLDFGAVDTSGTAPRWAGLNFIEQRVPTKDDKRDEFAEEKALAKEIERIRREKADFVAELIKAKDLLKLQRDIQKDNDAHY